MAEKIKEFDLLERINNLGFSLLRHYRKEYILRVVIEDCNGYRYDVSFFSLEKNKNPDFVNFKNPFSIYNISIWLEENTNFELTKNNIYQGNKNNLELYCPNCKDIFYISWDNVKGGHGCGVCSGKQTGRFHSFGDIHKTLVGEWSNKNELSPYDFTSGENKTKIIWECVDCGHEWESTIKERLRTKGVKFAQEKFCLIKIDFQLFFQKLRLNGIRQKMEI